MKKILKIIMLTILILVYSLVLIACNSRNDFSEAEAITKAVKIHAGFPINPDDTITKELPIGGPQGSTAKVKFTTKVELVEKDTYLVTLTKDWGFSMNGTYVKSYWKYKVTPNSTKLIDSVDNDNRPNSMK